MTSCSTRWRTRRRSTAALAAGLLTCAATGAALLASPLERTTADFHAETTSAAMISVRSACVGDLDAYASNLIPGDAALRWSFSGAMPAGAVVHPDAASGPDLSATAAGLLQCDPADLSPADDVAGSLTLRPGAPGSGLVSTVPTSLGDAFTLLFWTTRPAAAGELASVSNGPYDVLSVQATAGGVVQVSALGADSTDPTDPVDVADPAAGSTAPASAPLPDDGAAHLVAVTLAAGTIELTVDGTGAASTTAADWPAGYPSTLTVGARPDQTSAGATVDEVTLLVGARDAAYLTSLAAADTWWTPGPVPAP